MAGTPQKLTWGPAPARGRKIGSLGKRQMFLLAPGNKLGDGPGEFRLYIYFSAEPYPVVGDGVRVRSEEAGMELAEELLRDFYRELKKHMEPKKTPARAGASKGKGVGRG